MSPEKARVIIIDDDKDFVADLKSLLIGDGHRIKAVAYSKEEGENLIRKLGETGEEIDVALLDGNLSEDSAGGRDGRELAEQVRNLLPGVKVISISASRQDWSDRPDIDTTEVEAILKAVSEA